MRDHIVIRNVHVPPGLVDKEQKHGMQRGLALGIGKQSAGQPWQVTTVRPNVATTYFYDAEGEITGIDQVATAWLVSGDWSDEVWADEVAVLTDVAWAMVDYLGLPENQFLPVFNTLSAELLTHEGMQAMLAADPEYWSETT